MSARYLFKRLGLTVVVVLLVMTLLSVLIHVIPGDPVRLILGPRAPEELVRTVREEMNLDEPVGIQVWDFVTRAAQGDLGNDFVSHLPVTSLIGQVLPHTLILTVVALALAGAIGIPIGVYAATRPNSVVDRVTAVIAITFITMPSYVAGLVLLLIFAVTLNMLPAIGAGSLSDPLDYGRHVILPATALAVSWVGYLARLVRVSMLEVLNMPYIRTAHALGVRERRIFYRYALRNAIIPTIAVLGVGLGSLMGGAIFVELIFNRPGLGMLVFNAIESRNYTVVRGGVLVLALLFIGANFLADMCYRILDPRIRFEEHRA